MLLNEYIHLKFVNPNYVYIVHKCICIYKLYIVSTHYLSNLIS